MKADKDVNSIKTPRITDPVPPRPRDTPPPEPKDQPARTGEDSLEDLRDKLPPAVN